MYQHLQVILDAEADFETWFDWPRIIIWLALKYGHTNPKRIGGQKSAYHEKYYLKYREMLFEI